MAQLAIPLIALGGFYIISNHNKNSNEENDGIEKFTNIPENYPILNKETLNNNYHD